MPLMHARQSEKVRGSLFGGRGSFPVPDYRRDVVAQVGERSVTDVDVLGENILVGHDAGQFEIAVRDRSRRVVVGN